MLIAVGFEQEELESIKKFGAVLPLSNEYVTWKVKDLIENKPVSESYHRINSPKIVIMHEVPKDKISSIMRGIREQIGKSVIFATTTPTSLDWTLDDLIKELEEEDNYFKNKK